MKRLIKAIGLAFYTVFAIMTTLFVGCSHMMPTKVPPLTEEFGYSVPNIKGITTVGINEGVYNIEVAKLETWRLMLDIVNKPMIEAHGVAVDWLSFINSCRCFCPEKHEPIIPINWLNKKAHPDNITHTG
jgi:hypothetical protein